MKSSGRNNLIPKENVLKRSILHCSALLFLASGGLLHGQAKLPVLSASIAIGGAGGWDYIAVDPASHYLYVSHSSQVHVVDPVGKKVVATLPNTPGVHGAAFAPEFSRAFITCGKDDTVQVIDTKTFKPVKTLKATGKKPDAVLFEPSTKRVFVMNNGGNSITVIDAAALNILGTIALSGAPEFAQADGAGRVFVNLEDKNAVAVIDAASMKVLQEWPLAPHATPTGMAIDAAHQRLFVGCRSGQLAILDTGTGKLVAAPAIGSGVDACAFDPSTGRVYASCKDGTVAVIDGASPEKYSLAGTLKTEAGSKTMTLDPATHQVFIPAAGAPGTPGDPKAGFQILVYQP
jgi:YVTN family beta-propeller protein